MLLTGHGFLVLGLVVLAPMEEGWPRLLNASIAMACSSSVIGGSYWRGGRLGGCGGRGPGKREWHKTGNVCNWTLAHVVQKIADTKTCYHRVDKTQANINDMQTVLEIGVTSAVVLTQYCNSQTDHTATNMDAQQCKAELLQNHCGLHYSRVDPLLTTHTLPHSYTYTLQPGQHGTSQELLSDLINNYVIYWYKFINICIYLAVSEIILWFLISLYI